MKYLHFGLLLLVAFCAFSARADSTVVINEIMYHPSTNEALMEWLELRNLMSVDMDISGWSLADGIDYTFPAGTIIAGGGYLVVASSPPTLMAAAGLANVLGPFAGRISNSGETLQLLNNDQRVMDSITYGVDGAWPMAANGAGVSLAKLNPNAATADVSNWAPSAQIGGTPGADNFPPYAPTILTTNLASINGVWKYNDSGTDLGTSWSAANADDSGWASGSALFYRGNAALPAATNTVLAAGRTTYYFRTKFVYSGDLSHTQLQLQPLIDDGAVFYLNGVEIYRYNLPAGTINYFTLASAAVGDATYAPAVTLPDNLLVLGTNVLAVEVHQAHSIIAYPQAVLNSAPVGYWRLGETNGTAVDVASAAGVPQMGAQNGIYSGIAPANFSQTGLQPGALVGNQIVAGFEINNFATRFAGNNDNGDDVVIISDPGVFNYSTNRAFSLEAWVNGAATQESGAGIISKGFGGGGEQYTIDVQNNLFRFYIRDSAATATTTSATFGPNGTWQHVVAVYDQPAGIMRLYVNAALAASATPRATLLSTADPVTIGARKPNNTGGYSLNFDGLVDEVAIYNRALTTNEITAHFNATFDASAGSPPDTNDVVFGLQLNALQTVPPPVVYKVAFNELSAASDTFGLELINYDTNAVNLGGFSLVRLRGSTASQYVFSSQTLPSGGFLQLTKTLLGFGANSGDQFFLYAPNGSNVLDAVVSQKSAIARYPDGLGPWLHPAQLTPAATNSFVFHNEIVINEIMYHPRPSVGTNDNPPSWLELYNRGSNAVNLTGWQFSSGIGYAFATNKIIPAGGYLVVAQNPAAMSVLYPSIDVVGPYTGKLSGSGDLVELDDASGNPANQVQYFNDGRWPGYAHGGGSSLELRDPHADNSKPEAWAASNEGAKSTWQTYTYRAVAQTPIPGSPSLWNELNLGLIDGAGEVLLDDFSVVESPDTAPVQLIQNGSFDAGSASHWRFRGNHRHSRVEPEAGNPANYVLHLVSTGASEYQGNQIETTFLAGHSVVDGRTYEISFRAKWVAGAALLNTRLYFDRLARTTQLALPVNNGTPGLPNSTYATNIGPVYSGLQHSPVVPNAGQPVTISVNASDPDGVSSVKLWYAPEGSAWSSVAMTNAGGSLYTATLPGQSTATLVQFYVEGRDGLNVGSFFPANGTNSRALYRVNDGQALVGPAHNFRIIMTQADATFMHAQTNVLSNESLGGTVLYDEQEIFYDIGVRLKGSFVGRDVPRVGFTVTFDPSRLFRGIHEEVALDRSQGTFIGQGEILVKHIASHAGGIPNMYDDLVHCISPRAQDTSMAQLRMAAFGDVFLDSQYQNGSDGLMYECEVLRYSSTTADGTTEGLKIPGSGYVNVDLADYGTDPETYRWTLLQSNNRTGNDYTRIIAMSQTFSLTGTNLDVQTPPLMDLDEWMRTWAFESLIGVGDGYFTGTSPHNFRMYVRPADQKVLAMPWDWDSCFIKSATANLVGTGNLAKLVNRPGNLHAYYGHLYDLINTTFNMAYMGRWTQHYGSLAGQDFSGILNYIGQRSSFVMGQLPAATPFAITSNQGNNFGTNNTQVTINGTGSIQVKTIQVNGIDYLVTWTSLTNWSLTIPLNAGTNSFTLQGFDLHGNVLSNSTDTIVITNSGVGAPQPVVINEWMADNAGPNGFADPVDGLFKDWFELYNPNPGAIDLSGCFLTDTLALPTQWQVPTNTTIAGNGFLLVWADNLTNLNGLGTNGDLHVNFKLSKDGDSIGLFAPDGVRPLSTVTFGAQSQNVSQGRFPDGSTNGIFPMTAFTPRQANFLPPPQFTSLSLAPGFVTLVWQAIPGMNYHLQYKTNLNDVNWTDVAPDISATNNSVTFTNATSTDAQRFYRLLRFN
jgi:hypothetical protein